MFYIRIFSYEKCLFKYLCGFLYNIKKIINIVCNHVHKLFATIYLYHYFENNITEKYLIFINIYK